MSGPEGQVKDLGPNPWASLVAQRLKHLPAMWETFPIALFTTAKIWIQSKYPSTEKWIKKMWNIYTMEYFTQPSKRKK